MLKNYQEPILTEKLLKRQGKNLTEAINLVLEANRQTMEEELKGTDFRKEEIGEVLV